MSSLRLPGKVLQPVLGRPMIVRQLERVRLACVDVVAVATSLDPSDDPLVEVVERTGTPCHRGSLSDVLDRMYRAAAVHDARHVVRLTADCPLLDYRVIDAAVGLHLKAGGDYTSNTLRRTYPDGEDVEVMTFAALERAHREAREPGEREHVTPYIYAHPDRFDVAALVSPVDCAHLRWTVDYREDLELVRRIFAEFADRPESFSVEEILALYARQPQLHAINAAVNPALRSAATRGTGR
jgi:spore coat polysaccharide biosynthesis protein SpsF